MLAGHVGVGLALKGVEPRASAGALVAASLALDLLLGVLVLAGVERFDAPADFAARRYLEFDFPFSHSLLAALGSAALAGVVVAAVVRGRGLLRVALVLAAAVALHWPCDWLVHARPLPLWPGKAAPLGPALWTNLPAALAVEGALVALGAIVYLRAARWVPRGRRFALVAVALLLAGFTFAAQWRASEPPPLAGAAWSWIATPLVLATLFGALDRPARGRVGAPGLGR